MASIFADNIPDELQEDIKEYLDMEDMNMTELMVMAFSEFFDKSYD